MNELFDKVLPVTLVALSILIGLIVSGHAHDLPKPGDWVLAYTPEQCAGGACPETQVNIGGNAEACQKIETNWKKKGRAVRCFQIPEEPEGTGK